MHLISVIAAVTPTEPPQDNGSLVVPIALLIFFGVVGTLIFIASRYRNDQ